MKRPGYREAVEWLVCNDDCYWLGDPQFGMSVSASLVRDLFGIEKDKFYADLRRALKRVHPNHEALRRS